MLLLFLHKNIFALYIILLIKKYINSLKLKIINVRSIWLESNKKI